MLSLIDRYWRVAGTGLSFAIFGIGGVVLRILIFPLLNIFIWTPELRLSFARKIIRQSFWAFIEAMRILGVISYSINGIERIQRKGLLVIANHPTLIDTVFLMALIKDANCIVKSELWSNPFTHGPVSAAGYISNASGAEMVEDCISSLESGSNLIIFPEGTRTPSHGATSFKRGAANIAVRGALNITPVTIECSPPTLRKGDKWWHIPPRRPHFKFEIREDIPIRPFLTENRNEVLATRDLTNYLQDYFKKESALCN